MNIFQKAKVFSLLTLFLDLMEAFVKTFDWQQVGDRTTL